MSLKKTALLKWSIPAAMIFSILILSSCGGTAPLNQHTASRPVPPPPSLFVLSSQGDLLAYRADGTNLWQASAAANSNSMPMPSSGTHLVEAGQMIIVATDVVELHLRSLRK